MKRYNINKEDKLKVEVEEHSTKEKRDTTGRKTKLRQQHINLIRKIFPKAKNILCMGCRDDSEVLDFINAGFNAVGVDIANESKYIKCMDMHELTRHFSVNEFDIVYASHVLEHSYDPELALKNIRSVAKIGTFILLPLGGRLAGPLKVDPGQPSETHPAIFDLMNARVKDLDELLAKPELLSDFASLGNFKAKYYQLCKIDFELALKFSE